MNLSHKLCELTFGAQGGDVRARDFPRLTDVFLMAKHKPGFGRWLRNNFFAGVVVVTPIAATSWLIYTFVTFVDRSVGGLIEQISGWTGLPIADFYGAIDGPLTIPGLGVLIAFVFLTFLGVLARNIIGRFFIGLGESIVDRLPFIRSIYAPIKQILETVFRDQGEAFKDVALVEYPKEGSWALCFVTATAQGEIADQLAAEHNNGEPNVAVFIPTTPNPTSGFLLYVPRSKLRILDMSVEDGARAIISFGIVTHKPNGNDKKPPIAAVLSPVSAPPAPVAAAPTATPTAEAAAPAGATGRSDGAESDRAEPDTDPSRA